MSLYPDALLIVGIALLTAAVIGYRVRCWNLLFNDLERHIKTTKKDHNEPLS